MNRYSMAPGSLKKSQISHLNKQIAQLQANICDMENLLSISSKQMEYMRELGILHASL